MLIVYSSFTLDQAFANNLSNWPVLISNGSGAVTVTVSGNIIFTNDSQNFIVGSGNQVIIEGANNVIDVSGVAGYKGLGLNDSTLSPISTLTIQNLGITTHGGSTLNNTFTNKAGWFVSGENYSNGSHADVSNCYSTGFFYSYSGGIFGQNCQGTATNCYNTSIIQQFCGGIFGANCSGTANNCYSTGIIVQSSGGIFGANCSGTATNCYSTGSIGIYAGGIFGQFYANSTATNCYSTGSIANDGGGIFGYFQSSANNISSATKCFSTGTISGNGAGGIFGHSDSQANALISLTATNCFSTGLISGVNSGGIFGTSVNVATFTATNCYSIGNGLPGDYGNGQIFGITGTNANINAINCYGAGTSPNGICGNNYSGNPLTITNCYNANGTWSDTTANSNLTGTGGSLGVIGTKWTSVLSANTPYKLTAFNTQIYSPNTATINASDPYTTSVGNTAFNNFNKILNNGSATATINGSTGTIAFTNTSTPGLDTVNVYALASSGFYGINTFALTINAIAPCFKKDTKILCRNDFGENVYIPIQNIRSGTLVKTVDNGFVSVDMIGTSTLYNSGNNERIQNRLYRCSQSQYPELNEDLIITGFHSILETKLTDKQSQKTIELLGELFITGDKYRLMASIDERAKPYEKEGEFQIYHLALENDNYYENYGIYANGLLVETCSKRYLKELSGMRLL